LHEVGLVKLGVEDAQDQNCDGAGENEKRTGNQPAFGAMQQPADVGRELLRFWAGQQHTVIERVQETILAYPFFLFNENAVHHCDLTRGPAKTVERDFHPHPKCLTKANAAAGQKESSFLS
jgi:hypothetical protein